LLATPLSATRIVQGQWRALLRMFGAPLVLFLAAYSIGTFLNQQVTSGSGFWGPNSLLIVAITVAGTVTVIANVAALVWFGMWMGLTSRSANAATLKTIVFVQIIPWFVISVASWTIIPMLWMRSWMSGTGASSMVLWYPLLISASSTVLSLAKDAGFWLWARRKLHSEFRQRAARLGPGAEALRARGLRLAQEPQVAQISAPSGGEGR